MIATFRGEYRWLSNFHDKPIVWMGLLFKNRESAYQWSKLFGTNMERSHEASLYLQTTGKEAKNLSKELKPLTRPDWFKVNLGIMSEITHAHYTQNRDEREKLLITYPHKLVEGNNWHDRFWGVCDGTCRQPHAPGGLNWLGRIEMAERAYWLDLSQNDVLYTEELVKRFEEHMKNAEIDA